ncbi:MAG TPA: hypothetical protein VE623_25065 [Acidimicrobiales bacterium]|jgi:hypothetical protein|nr:hypothetical protein [Acidimicrobiales bacterium]
MRRRRRSGERPPVVVRRGDKVIDASVRARLLGLHILDIDAHVVVATARQGHGSARWETGPTALGAANRGGVPLPADGSTPPELARAVRLLAEGSSALDDARRLR